MTELVGAVQIPVPAPPMGQPVGDPMLFYCLAFFQAIANAYAPTGWNSVAPKLPDGTALPVVYRTFSHDPKRFSFNEKACPALYMWRDGVLKRRWEGQGARVATGTCKLLWIPPPIGNQDIARQRASFWNALYDTLDTKFEVGVDAAWKLVGDTYPSATSVARYGSVLHHKTGVRRMRFEGSEPITFEIPADGGMRRYEATEATLSFEESVQYIDQWAPMAAGDITVAANTLPMNEAILPVP